MRFTGPQDSGGPGPPQPPRTWPAAACVARAPPHRLAEMRLLLRTEKPVPEDKLPFLCGHGAELLRSVVKVARAEGSDAHWLLFDLGPPWMLGDGDTKHETADGGARYLAALALETLVAGDAFLIDPHGRAAAWPRAEREREL